MSMKPSIGRIVHYVLANGDHRAALVVNAWGMDNICNLTVHLDQANDIQTSAQGGWDIKPKIIPVGAWGSLPNTATLSAPSSHYDETGKKPGSWHWPERE